MEQPYQSDDDEKIRKPRKPNKKKRIKGLPNKVVVIKNADKDVGNWSETWSYPKSRSPGHIPHSFRLLALGAPGRGKTNYMKNIFLKHQSSSKKFQRLIVVTCDLSSREWEDMEPDMFLDRLPDISVFEEPIKTCVIIDDYEFERCGKEEMRKLTTLFRMISSHKSVSIMASYQSFFHVPTIARKTANCFIIYKPTSENELQTISNRVGIKYEDLRQMFKRYANNYYDMIFIDMTKDTPYRLRKNIYDVIKYDSSSDAELSD
jgi:hypothetical protein